MKFFLTQNAHLHNLPEVERLTPLGFEFKEHQEPYGTTHLCTNPSGGEREASVEIGSLEELLAFTNRHGAVTIHDGEGVGGPNSLCGHGRPWINLCNDYE